MKRIPCTACAHVPSQIKIARMDDPKRKCHECHDVGYIEINDVGCTHLPPNDIEYEPMVGGWMCACGASGPWAKSYDKAYLAAQEKLGITQTD